jgi:hypothetical protein
MDRPVSEILRRPIKVAGGAEFMQMLPFRIFIGWDKREPDAYDVASFSPKRRASIPVEIMPIKLDDLVARDIYACQPAGDGTTSLGSGAVHIKPRCQPTGINQFEISCLTANEGEDSPSREP